MRLEDLEKESYIKSADTVERYLLDIIRQYFVDSVNVPETSRESFIIDALAMMKEEFDFDGLGVMSISLPSGETRVGNVSLSLDDLDGEPMISPKLSAFNVNFGSDANTACEGNDPRLYDARTPIAHTHQISEIFGLEGMLSSINSRISSISSTIHSHSNKDVLDKLVYTGSKSYIDLSIIDGLEDEVRDAITEVNNRITECCDDVSMAIQDIENKKNEINNRISNLVTYIDQQNAAYLTDLQTYVLQLIEGYNAKILAHADSTYATKDWVLPLVEVANQDYIFAARDEWLVSRDLTWTTEFKSISTHYATMILDELEKRDQNLRDVLLDMYLMYTDDNDNITKIPIPYTVYGDDGTAVGVISANISIEGSNNGQVYLEVCCKRDLIPDNIYDAKFIIDAYSKKPLVLASYGNNNGNGISSGSGNGNP